MTTSTDNRQSSTLSIQELSLLSNLIKTKLSPYGMFSPPGLTFQDSKDYISYFKNERSKIEDLLFTADFSKTRGKVNRESFNQVIHKMVDEIEQTFSDNEMHTPMTFAQLLAMSNPLLHPSSFLEPSAKTVLSNCITIRKFNLSDLFDEAEKDLNEIDLTTFQSLKYKLLLVLSNDETGNHLLRCNNETFIGRDDLTTHEVNTFVNFYQCYLAYISQLQHFSDLVSQPFNAEDLAFFKQSIKINEWQAPRNQKISRSTLETPVNNIIHYLDTHKEDYIPTARPLNHYVYNCITWLIIILIPMLILATEIVYLATTAVVVSDIFIFTTMALIELSGVAAYFLVNTLLSSFFSPSYLSVNAPTADTALPPTEDSAPEASTPTVTHHFKMRTQETLLTPVLDEDNTLAPTMRLV